MNAPVRIPANELGKTAQTVGEKMAAARRWLLWKAVQRKGGGKTAKVPYYASGKPRSATDTPEDAAQLVSFQEAQTAYAAGGYAGLGFALGPDGTGNFWQGIDFDGIAKNPHLVPLMDKMAGYRETSPSGDGAHWIGYGPSRFETLTQFGGVEAYSHGRFFTYTGKDPKDHPVVDLNAVVQKHLVPLRPEVTERPAPPANTFMATVRDSCTLDELGDLLARIPVEKLGHFDWCNVLMGVHHQFGTTADAAAAMTLCDKWSSTDTRPGQYVEKKAGSVAHKWASFGRNPKLSEPGAAITIRTVRKLAAKYSPLDLGAIVAGAPSAPMQSSAFGAVMLSDFIGAASAEYGWLIKGVLPGVGLGQMFGDTGAGKTFEMLDMMIHVARGEPWNGHRTRKGNVVYVAAEGAAGARNRFKAYCQHHGIDAADLDIIVLPAAPNLTNDEDVTKLGTVLAQMGRVDLVVIDTLAQVMGGADENGSEGMGLAIANLTRLAQALGTMITVVHHSGKNAALGARGWSGQKGAMDAQFEVIKTPNGTRSMTVTKMKDGEDGKVYPFQLKVVTLGVDADGDEVTSCVALPVSVLGDLGNMGFQPVAVTTDPRIVGKWEQRVMRHIGESLKVGIPLEFVEVVEAVKNSIVPEVGKPDRRRDNLTRAINTLADKDVFSISGTQIVAFDPSMRKASAPSTEDFSGAESIPSWLAASPA